MEQLGEMNTAFKKKLEEVNEQISEVKLLEGKLVETKAEFTAQLEERGESLNGRIEDLEYQFKDINLGTDIAEKMELMDKSVADLLNS